MSSRLATSLTALLLCASPAFAATIRVPADQPTIQAAVNAADDGDVIEIKGGKYNEDVTIADLDDLTLVGKGNVTINATDRGILADNCSGLTISKIKVDGGFICFQIQDCVDTVLEKFQAKNAERDGVFVLASSNIRIEKGKVSDCGHDGVSFADENSGDPVNDSSITKVKVQGCDADGIDVLGARVTVTKCSVRDAGDDSFESDIEAEGDIEFVKCKARNAVDENFELFAPNSKATNCTSTRARDDGFDVEGAGSIVTGCKSIKDGQSGFEVEITSDVSLIDCTSIRADDDGIAVIDSARTTIDGCTSLRSGFDGIFIDNESTDTVVRDCKASKNRDSDLDDEGTNTSLEGKNKFKTIDPNN